MRKRDRTIVMAMVIVLMSGVMYGQGDYRDLRERKVTVHMNDSGLGTVFRYLMLNYGVVIGFEKSNLDIAHNDFGFDTNGPFQASKNLYGSGGGRASVSMSVVTRCAV